MKVSDLNDAERDDAIRRVTFKDSPRRGETIGKSPSTSGSIENGTTNNVTIDSDALRLPMRVVRPASGLTREKRLPSQTGATERSADSAIGIPP